MNISPNSVKRLIRTTLRLLEPPPEQNVLQWAEAHRRIAKGVSPAPGVYRADQTPYQREPQESFTDPAVQMTVLLWASRLGKTEILNNLEGYTIDADPRSMLIVYPTLDSAKKWSKEFFMPMIRASPCLRGKISDPRSRDGNNTVLSKQFPGGRISAIGANSPSGFRQIQAPVIICDEIDAMENGHEGDPVPLALKRADNYPDSIQVLSSTPTLKGASRIEAWLERSDKRQWFVPCPRCGRSFVLLWRHVVFDKEHPEAAHLVCEHCQAVLTDADRRAMVLAGEWRPTQPFTGIRGYWLNALNTTFPAKKGFASKLHQLVQEFLDATAAGREALMVFINTVLAESFEDVGEKIDTEPLLARREPYGCTEADPLPAAVLLLTLGVDTQDDRLEWEVVGWGLDEETWGVARGVIFGNPVQPDPWTRLDDVLARRFPRADGAVLTVAAAAVDSGNPRHTKAVYTYVRPRLFRRVWAVKGSATPGAPLVMRPRKSKVYRVQLFSVGTDTAKATLFSRLQLTEPGPRYCHFPLPPPSQQSPPSRDSVQTPAPRGDAAYDEDFFKQLTAEELRTTYRHGFPVRTWVKIRARNEALDLRVYAHAAYEILNPNLPRIARHLHQTAAAPLKSETSNPPPAPAAESPPPPPAPPPAPLPPKPPCPARPARRGFVGRWRH